MPFSAPAAHIGVTDTYGVTLPAGAQAQAASRTQSVDVELPVGADGEIFKVLPHKKVKKEVSINYIGAPDLSAVSVGADLDPSTVKVTKTESTEEPNKNVACNITASAEDAFTQGSGTSAGAGSAEPTNSTLILKTVTFSLADSVRRSSEVKDVIITGGDGTPKWRGTCTKKNTFGVRFKGDVPSGLILGLAGAGVYGLTGGVLAVNKLVEEQKKDDANGGSYEGVHAPSAS